MYSNNLFQRFIMTCIMIGLLISFVQLGKEAMIIAIYIIQFKIYQELHMLSPFLYTKIDIKQWYLDWYLFITWSFLILTETFKVYYLSLYRIIGFLSYTLWFCVSISLFEPTQLKNQMGHFCWVQMINLYCTTQVYILGFNLQYGLYWFILPCSLVVCNDISAYLWGKWFGSRKLTKLSPNKTIEGFIGALVTTVLFGFWFASWLGQYPYLIKLTDSNINLGYHGLLMGIYASIAAPFGGFFASSIKRIKGMKDFAGCIPGHGGITDRMDCQLLMGIFTLVYYQYYFSS
ncbi:unnamed protein product [Cunninghamella echinulata]